MKISQQSMRRWRLRHTLGMPRNTTVTKPGREVKAIQLDKTIRVWIALQKDHGKRHHFAFNLSALILLAFSQWGVNSELLRYGLLLKKREVCLWL
jgi:hypothetical protein